MILEAGLVQIENHKKGLEKFLEMLPEQSVQLGPEMVKTLTMISKNKTRNLDAIKNS